MENQVQTQVNANEQTAATSFNYSANLMSAGYVNGNHPKVVVSTDTKASISDAVNVFVYPESYLRIETLANEREQWEQGALRTSNEQRNAILAKCFGLYKEMCDKSDKAKATKKALDSYIKNKGYKFTDSTHTLSKIVKCVFGVDRRRVSTYSLVLREALAQDLAANQVAEFISSNGGIEEIRRSKSPNAKTVKQRAEQGKQVLADTELGTVSSDKIAKKLDLAKAGNEMVAIVVQNADGSLSIKALVESESVLNAALASFYSKNKPAAENDAKNKETTDASKAMNQAIADAAA